MLFKNNMQNKSYIKTEFLYKNRCR